MNNFQESPVVWEEKKYLPVKENPVHYAPWNGTNTKMPGPYDLAPVDLPEDKKVDVTEVELKPIIQEIKESEELVQIRARKPQLLQSILILGAAFFVAKMIFGQQQNINSI